ncbi:8746_t:CDS:1, partial [Cetraspora pellucida]
LVADYNISINTVSDILKRKDYWLKINSNSLIRKSQRNHLPGFPLIEQALLVWVNHALEANITILEFMLTAQTQNFAELFQISNFKALECWLINFKHHAELRKFTRHGEALSAPLEKLP